MPISVLVTGGVGYIGSHLVQLLREEGAEVAVVDLVKPVEPIPGTTYFQADFTATGWAKEIANAHFDIVVHLGAKTSAPESVREPELYDRVNSYGSSQVWQYAIRTSANRVLYASTAAVYGDHGLTKVAETAQPKPLTPYGLSKLAGEQALFVIKPAPHLYSLRLFNVGGGQDRRELGEPTVLHALARAKNQGNPLVIHGRNHPTKDGTPVRDFVHVADVASAFAHIIFTPLAPTSGIYNVGTGRETSILELARLAGVETSFDDPRLGDISYSVADIRQIMALGWQPHKTLQEILP